jgi:hypothetical protein
VPVSSGDFNAALDALVARVNAATKVASAKSAAALMAAGMARTHVISGTLLRSWKMDPVQQGPDLYEWWVGPTVVYARRQELGFLPPHKDSLGREFPTAYGWPYVRPAYVETLPKIRTFINNAYRGAILGR